MIRILALLALLLLSSQVRSQTDTVWTTAPSLSLSGFVDIFYVYDFNQPATNARQPFFFNHNRHNEFNLNLGLVQLALEHPKYRANFALQTGVYANDNYAAEPGLLKSIFEANIGIALNADNTLWLDAGVLPSHIGFESAISMDNPTLTRSLPAENSPYFLTGAKLTFTPNEQWEFAGLLVNGWQRIQRLPGNSLPSVGTQLVYTPTEGLLLNWSTFIGTDDPDERRRLRYFNNIYGQFSIQQNLRLIAGIDLGAQQLAKGSSDYDIWFTPVLIGQYDLNERWQAAFRVEYYQDEDEVIIVPLVANGFRTTGLSLNLDYCPNTAVAGRIEARWLRSADPLFIDSTGALSDSNFFVGTSLAIKFATQSKR